MQDGGSNVGLTIFALDSGNACKTSNDTKTMARTPPAAKMKFNKPCPRVCEILIIFMKG